MALAVAEAGLEVEDGDLGEWTPAAVLNWVGLGVELATATDLLQGGELVGVEVDLTHPGELGHIPTPGQCEIADFIHRGPQGLVVTDHKVALKLDPKWVEKRLGSTAYSWQFWHYAWRASQVYGEPVVMIRQHLIILSPKPRTYLHAVATPPEQVQMWERSARQWWRLMSTGFDAQNFSACEDYGGCPFLHGCHQLAGDEALFPTFYDPVTKPGVRDI